MATVTLPCQFCGTRNRLDLARHQDRPKCASCGKPFLVDRPVKIPEEHFDTAVLDAQVPVLVDFYADWCGPCRMMAPALDEIAHERAGTLLVAKVDTDHAPGIGQRYGIRGIPYFGLFQDGKMVANAVGAVGKRGLLELVDKGDKGNGKGET